MRINLPQVGKSNILLLPLFVCLLASCGKNQKETAESIATEEKPNIIFIIADDLNDAIGTYGGHPQVITPNMDRMAEMGVTFTNAYANSPICGPSRASLLSGLHAKSTGYFGYNFVEYHWKNNPALAKAPTFVEYMRKQGYKTLGTGKIQHNHQEDWGIWDEFSVPPSWGPWPWDGTSDEANEFGTLSEWRNSVVHPNMPDNYSIDDQFGSLDDVPNVSPNPTKNIEGHEGWRLHFKPFKYNSKDDRDLMPDELNAQWVEEKLAEQHKKPFLMCVGINRPHSPMFAPQEFFDMYGLDTLELAVAKEGDRDDLSKALLEHSHTKTYGSYKYQQIMKAGGKEHLREWTQAYLANVSFVDVQIGKIIDALQNSPYKDNTYVVLTSDHGYHMGEKELMFKYTLWDEGSKVPFLVLGPDVIAGKRENHPVSLIDLFPTFLDWANVTKEEGLQLDGHSFRTFTQQNPKTSWTGKDFALITLASDTHLEDGEPGKVNDQHYSIVTKKYRYSRANNGEEELYDHEKDPYEWENLVGHPDYQSILSTMREKFSKEIF